MSNKITSIVAREILDSRGNPTVSVRVEVEGGISAVAGVPSGASTGSHEAHELRDGDKKRYGGAGVLNAVANVNGEIAEKLRGMDVTLQRRIDETMIELDGTEQKTRLGANAILGVSLAAARAGAMSRGIALYRYLHSVYGFSNGLDRMPLPFINVLNGGRHADFSIDAQECMLIPQMASLAERVRAGSETFHALAKVLKKRGFATTVGDEGGYAPKLGSVDEALEVLVEAIGAAGYEAGKDIKLGMDVAASELYDDEKKTYHLTGYGDALTGAQMTDIYADWIKRFPLVSIEDGLAEDDWENWEQHTAKLGGTTTLIGDDLFVTNPKRLRMGIERHVANALLVKVNQIGTVSEAVDAVQTAQKAGYKIVVSHRSGETADTFIADLAVAVGAEGIKTGSMSRSERIEKYNRLMEIEMELKS